MGYQSYPVGIPMHWYQSLIWGVRHYKLLQKAW